MFIPPDEWLSVGLSSRCCEEPVITDTLFIRSTLAILMSQHGRGSVLMSPISWYHPRWKCSSAEAIILAQNYEILYFIEFFKCNYPSSTGKKSTWTEIWKNNIMFRTCLRSQSFCSVSCASISLSFSSSEMIVFLASLTHPVLTTDDQ